MLLQTFCYTDDCVTHPCVTALFDHLRAALVTRRSRGTLLNSRYMVEQEQRNGEAQVGKGGFGIVFRCTDKQFGSEVAIKLGEFYDITKEAARHRKAYEAVRRQSSFQERHFPDIIPIYEVFP